MTRNDLEKFGTRKIGEPSKEAQCLHPGHKIPSLMVFEPGTYEHVCPACGHRRVFRVPLRTA